VLYACNFAIATQSPGTAISLEVCSFSIIDKDNEYIEYMDIEMSIHNRYAKYWVCQDGFP
jgi:hypothetical protein